MDFEEIIKFCKWMGEVALKYWAQELLVKPLTKELLVPAVSRLKNVITSFVISDTQLVQAYYIFIIVAFGSITLHLSGGVNLDFLTRTAVFLGGATTYVSIMFLCLVSANVRSK